MLVINAISNPSKKEEGLSIAVTSKPLFYIFSSRTFTRMANFFDSSNREMKEKLSAVANQSLEAIKKGVETQLYHIDQQVNVRLNVRSMTVIIPSTTEKEKAPAVIFNTGHLVLHSDLTETKKSVDQIKVEDYFYDNYKLDLKHVYICSTNQYRSDPILFTDGKLDMSKNEYENILAPCDLQLSLGLKRFPVAQVPNIKISGKLPEITFHLATPAVYDLLVVFRSLKRILISDKKKNQSVAGTVAAVVGDAVTSTTPSLQPSPKQNLRSSNKDNNAWNVWKNYGKDQVAQWNGVTKEGGSGTATPRHCTDSDYTCAVTNSCLIRLNFQIGKIGFVFVHGDTWVDITPIARFGFNDLDLNTTVYAESVSLDVKLQEIYLIDLTDNGSFVLTSKLTDSSKNSPFLEIKYEHTSSKCPTYHNVDNSMSVSMHSTQLNVDKDQLVRILTTLAKAVQVIIPRYLKVRGTIEAEPLVQEFIAPEKIRKGRIIFEISFLVEKFRVSVGPNGNPFTNASISDFSLLCSAAQNGLLSSSGFLGSLEVNESSPDGAWRDIVNIIKREKVCCWKAAFFPPKFPEHPGHDAELAVTVSTVQFDARMDSVSRATHYFRDFSNGVGRPLKVLLREKQKLGPKVVEVIEEKPLKWKTDFQISSPCLRFPFREEGEMLVLDLGKIGIHGKKNENSDYQISFSEMNAFLSFRRGAKEIEKSSLISPTNVVIHVQLPKEQNQDALIANIHAKVNISKVAVLLSHEQISCLFRLFSENLDSIDYRIPEDPKPVVEDGLRDSTRSGTSSLTNSRHNLSLSDSVSLANSRSKLSLVESASIPVVVENPKQLDIHLELAVESVFFELDEGSHEYVPLTQPLVSSDLNLFFWSKIEFNTVVLDRTVNFLSSWSSKGWIFQPFAKN